MQESLQQLVKQQSDATSGVCPVPVDVGVASTSIWINKWVDYSNKYGLGYQLSDGSVGVLFNDSTKMVLSPDQAKIESIEQSSRGYMVTRLTLTEYPPNLTKKVTLLKYFKNYMNEHLLNGGDGDVDAKLAESVDMMHVTQWRRHKNAIVFRLSQGVVQINFFDHAKLVLNTSLGLITFIDKSRKTNTYNVKDIAATATTYVFLHTNAPTHQRTPHCCQGVPEGMASGPRVQDACAASSLSLTHTHAHAHAHAHI